MCCRYVVQSDLVVAILHGVFIVNLHFTCTKFTRLHVKYIG